MGCIVFPTRVRKGNWRKCRAVVWQLPTSIRPKCFPMSGKWKIRIHWSYCRVRYIRRPVAATSLKHQVISLWNLELKKNTNNMKVRVDWFILFFVICSFVHARFYNITGLCHFVLVGFECSIALTSITGITRLLYYPLRRFRRSSNVIARRLPKKSTRCKYNFKCRKILDHRLMEQF